MKKPLLIITLIFVNCVSFGQVDAGEDLTISTGLPVTLTAIYKGYTGIPVTAEDDYFVGPFDIGFNFTYFDNTYDQFAIGPNGLVSFDVPDIIGFSYHEKCAIPNNIFKKTIMGPYQDLFKRPTAKHSNYIYYKLTGNAPNRKLIIGWCEAPMYNCESALVTYQIVLNESDNSIVNHLINKPACGYLDNAATHGLNYDNNLGCYVSGRNMTSWTAFHESWEFSPNGNNYDITQISYEPEVIAPAGKISWEWYEGGYPDGELISDEKTVTVNPLENNIYTAVITLCGGETYADDVHVTVIPIPNAFRPTSNIEANREFRLMAEQHANIEKFRMQIYNRWGQLIFETDNVNKGGVCSFKGKACQMGLYVWIIYYEDDGEKITNKGNVTLLK